MWLISRYHKQIAQVISCTFNSQLVTWPCVTNLARWPSATNFDQFWPTFCFECRAHEGGISDTRHWAIFSIRHWHSTQNQCRPTLTLRIGDPTLDTPLQPDTDSLIPKSTPDTQTPLHGPLECLNLVPNRHVTFYWWTIICNTMNTVEMS